MVELKPNERIQFRYKGIPLKATVDGTSDNTDKVTKIE
jgi:hypothetical protein